VRAPGRLIVIEGLDGVGKTTVSKLLAARMRARWSTTPGEALRGASGGRPPYETALGAVLFYASSVVDAAPSFALTVSEGRDVVCDRYWLSTLAGAAARGVELPLDVCERYILPAADTFLLTASTEVRANRLIARGRMTPDDHVSLCDAWSATMLDAMRRHRRHALVGRYHEIDTSRLDARQVVERISWILRLGQDTREECIAAETFRAPDAE
jgi:dTMP kinase